MTSTNCETVRVKIFVYALFRDFRNVNKDAKSNGVNIDITRYQYFLLMKTCDKHITKQTIRSRTFCSYALMLTCAQCLMFDQMHLLCCFVVFSREKGSTIIIKFIHKISKFESNETTEFNVNPLTPTVAAWVSECPDVKNYKWRLNPVWHKMICSCTHMATVGVKGLIQHGWASQQWRMKNWRWQYQSTPTDRDKVIWNVLYPAMNEANFVNDCLPEPPTPTSSAWPLAVRMIRDILTRFVIASCTEQPWPHADLQSVQQWTITNCAA